MVPCPKLHVTRDSLRSSIRQQSQNPTMSQRTAVEEKRHRLMARINKFHETAQVMTNGIGLEIGGVPEDDAELCLQEADVDGTTDTMEDVVEEESSLDNDGDADSPAEIMEVWMPSWMPNSHGIFDGILLALRQEEMELRKGQANDCLEKLRQALGDRSVVFREKIHSNKSAHHHGTRSKKELQKITFAINKQARAYRRSRGAMIRLGADHHTLEVYQTLKAEDLILNKEVTEENRYGQSSDRLAWFWRINNAKDSQKNKWMDECE
jgi:hypothetical protein